MYSEREAANTEEGQCDTANDNAMREIVDVLKPIVSVGMGDWVE